MVRDVRFIRMWINLYLFDLVVFHMYSSYHDPTPRYGKASHRSDTLSDLS